MLVWQLEVRAEVGVEWEAVEMGVDLVIVELGVKWEAVEVGLKWEAVEVGVGWEAVEVGVKGCPGVKSPEREGLWKADLGVVLMEEGLEGLVVRVMVVKGKEGRLGGSRRQVREDGEGKVGKGERE